MKIAKMDFTTDPERIAWEPYDCLWVCLAHRNKPSAPQGKLLQWVDWKLFGKLSEFILKEGFKQKLPTVVFSGHQISTPYVILDSHYDWEWILKNSEGMKFKHILCVCEDSEALQELRSTIGKHKAEEYPQSLLFALE